MYLPATSQYSSHLAMFLNFSSIPAGYPAIHIQRRYEGTSVAYLAADGAMSGQGYHSLI